MQDVLGFGEGVHVTIIRAPHNIFLEYFWLIAIAAATIFVIAAWLYVKNRRNKNGTQAMADNTCSGPVAGRLDSDPVA